MNGCKVSIVTVCLNSVDTIERTIQSVISQSYTNIEYIIIDGGSTDGTLDVIKKYDSYVYYWISESDNGIYDAMNKGAQLATGLLIGFLNSDDWYESDAVLNVVKTYEMHIGDVYYGDFTYIDEKGVSHIGYRHKEKIEDIIYFEMPLAHPSTFILTKLQKEYGFNTQYRFAADYDLILRLYSSGKKFVLVDNILSIATYGGLSTKRFAYLSACECRTISRHCLLNNKYLYARYINKVDEKHFNNAVKCIVRRMKKNGFIDRWILDVFGVYENIWIFGAGMYGRKCLSLLQSIQMRLVHFIDNDADKLGSKIDGVKVQPPNVLSYSKYDAIIISPIQYEDEIKKQIYDILPLDTSTKCFTYSKLKEEVFCDYLKKIAGLNRNISC